MVDEFINIVMRYPAGKIIQTYGEGKWGPKNDYALRK
jgi:hypothetical protein